MVQTDSRTIKRKTSQMQKMTETHWIGRKERRDREREREISLFSLIVIDSKVIVVDGVFHCIWLHNGKQNELKFGNPADYDCAIYMYIDYISIAAVHGLCSQSNTYRIATNRMWLSIYGLSVCLSLSLFLSVNFLRLTSIRVRCFLFYFAPSIKWTFGQFSKLILPLESDIFSFRGRSS